MNTGIIAIKYPRGICSVLLFRWQINAVSADMRDDVNKGMRQYLWKECKSAEFEHWSQLFAAQCLLVAPTESGSMPQPPPLTKIFIGMPPTENRISFAPCVLAIKARILLRKERR
jgi:hypothetical protein